MKRFVISMSVALLMLTLGFGSDLAWAQAKKDLNQASVDGDLERVKALVGQGEDLETKNMMGMTPLVVAAMNDRTAVCEFLIEKGADVNAKDERGQTALYFAVDKGNKELVELLVKKGADVNATAGRGENAFSLAKKKGNAEIADFLAKNGGKDPVVQDLYADEYYGADGGVPAGARAGVPRAAVTASVAQPDVQVDLLADPNEIMARIKTFDGLEKVIVDLAKKSSTETRHWGQSRYDNRTSLARAVETQVEGELAEVRKIAVEEKAQKTTKAIDDLVKMKQERYKVVHRELLQQRREVSLGQSARGGLRGSVRGSGRSSRSGRYSPELQGSAGTGRMGYEDGAGYEVGADETGRPGRPGRPEEQLDRETEEEVRLWAQATIDNKPDLAKSLHPKILAEFAAIRAVAVEEKAEKTAAAIDGILLARQVRFDVYVKTVEALRQAATAGQDPRLAGRNADQAGRAVSGRRGRTTRGGVESTRGGRTRRR